MITRFCIICKVYRTFNIFEAYNKKKKRVICGFCGTVLLGENELIAIIQNSYNDCCD